MKYHFSNKKNILVILDNIRSCLNVGSIIRTCDGAGVNDLVSIGITPTKDHDKVKKTSLGAEKYVKNTHLETTEEGIKFIKNLQTNNYKVIAIEQTKKSTKFNKKYINQFNKLAFIFGNEITGISNEILENVDLTMEIPMLGYKNSLNVSITVGIVLYSLIL